MGVAIISIWKELILVYAPKNYKKKIIQAVKGLPYTAWIIFSQFFGT